MKKMWKISVCALAATFTFSALTACDKGEQEEKSNITAEQVLALGDSIQESLSDVQSFSFGIEDNVNYVLYNGADSARLSVRNGYEPDGARERQRRRFRRENHGHDVR